MKKFVHSKIICSLLVLVMLMQNLAVPVTASTDDGSICENHYEWFYPDESSTCIKSGWTRGCNVKYAVMQ